MKVRLQIPTFRTGCFVSAVAWASLGLAGCGNTGEGQIKVGSSVRKSLGDDAAPAQQESTVKTKGSDADLKSRIGGKGND